jgi:hypothetical protein
VKSGNPANRKRQEIKNIKANQSVNPVPAITGAPLGLPRRGLLRTRTSQIKWKQVDLNGQRTEDPGNIKNESKSRKENHRKL